MELEQIVSLGYVALITFGVVWIVSKVAEKRFKIELDSDTKFGLSVVVAIAVSFIPADLGNEIVNRIRDGFGVATGIAGFYQMSSKIIKNA